ncbi:SF3b1 domain-containing protein [Mycena venus]|uniref:SF3b1 domain-containing protein n=1 Tax=Mycena venus TaxID=2733690 RepID=A0A8H6Z7K2_9AGAR|nr:SF3b1 domain-containing protein [Mycena venus]
MRAHAHGNLRHGPVILSLPSTMSFAAYAAPHPQTRFSPQFFASITIADAADLIRDNRPPRILSKSSVSKWAWDRTEPTAISEIIVAAGEDIPCMDDMYLITGAAEIAYYKEGAHSVCLQIGNRIVRYHLSKLHLILGANNQMYNLAAAARLLDRIVSGKPLLPNLIEEFKLNGFSERLAGFHVTQTPIYMLGCLLGERWAEEDLLNARAEIIY